MATPIGNLEDVTLRSLRILEEVVLVLAEDTRTARRLLDRHGITARLLSYTGHNHATRLGSVLDALAHGDVALVSEAGMPGINDPGQALVAAVIAAGGSVSALPGPSAVPLAVALAGFPVQSFTYLGFLPHRRGERRRLLQANAQSGHALVAFETPHRLRESLADIDALLGQRPLAVCRELTKLHEEVVRGTADEALARFAEPRGEFTLVIAAGETRANAVSDAELVVFLDDQRSAGVTARDAIAAAIARFGVSRRQAYEVWQSGSGA